MRYLALIVAALTGCSFGLNTKRPSVTDKSEPSCSRSNVAPVLDLVVGGSLATIGLANEDARGPALIAGGVLSAIGLYGLSQTKGCRAASAEWLTTRAETLEPVATKKRGGPRTEAEPAATASAGPPDKSEAPPTTINLAPAAQLCRVGATCSKAEVCDPLRHACAPASQPGLEGTKCRGDHSCGAGLYCDWDEFVCRPGRVGRDGGLCRTDGSCDDGYSCMSGACIREAQPTGARVRNDSISD